MVRGPCGVQEPSRMIPCDPHVVYQSLMPPRPHAGRLGGPPLGSEEGRSRRRPLGRVEGMEA